MTSNALIAACGKDPQRARELLDYMMHEKIGTDSASWSIVIDSHIQAGNTAHAEKLLDKMEDARIGESIRSYQTLIQSAAKTGNMHCKE